MAQYRLPVKIFILNNQYMGMVRQWQELLHGGRYSESYMESLPDFVKLAEAFGAVGLRCHEPGQARRHDQGDDRHQEAGHRRRRRRQDGELLPDDPVGRGALRHAAGPGRHAPPSRCPKKAWCWCEHDRELASSHTISVLVDNEPGILARVVGLFSGRGYNIESLTVAETDAKEKLSRITIVTTGTPMVIEQIKAQLDRLVPVHKVHDLTIEGPHIERELALVKVKGTGEKRVEALRLADVFRAKVIDAKTDSFVFEVTGNVRQGRHLHRPDGRARPGRCRPHRHRRHDPRRRGALVVARPRRPAGAGGRPSAGRRESRTLDRAGGADRRRLRPARRAGGGLRHDAGRGRLGGGGAVRPAGAVRAVRLALPVFQVAGGLLPDLSRGDDVAPCARAAAGDDGSGAVRGSDGQIFMRALLLQLSNPKIMVFFGSIFLSVLPQRHAGLDAGRRAGPRGLRRVHLVRAARPDCFRAARRGPFTAGPSSGSTGSWAARWRFLACASPCPPARQRAIQEGAGKCVSITIVMPM